ncbi:T9SS type A sorting domain-containing protein [Flavobacterium zepuense]|uniref:T9SS type A sorting domain-containing protein n=1 Tax=Flavobacterium zepuense TaxID=2593302 RepID=A0A552UWY1_9FLAO|nr:T9SS type A sorting domain-containing protein [Flavobacterium zepuense]TRW22743.1 T9SS type A sorting domain-containing protein [Flavobacterium zepuense]
MKKKLPFLLLFLTILSYQTTVAFQDPCEPTANLAVTNITTTSATLSWTNPSGATSWEVELLPATAVPTGIGIVTTTNPYVVSDLLVCTEYKYYVRSICSEGVSSTWTGPMYFTTGCTGNTTCPVEEQCNYSFMLTDSGSNGWNGSTMSVVQNGVNVALLQLAAGGAQTVTVSLCDNVPFQLLWNNGGTAPTEIGVSIQNAMSQTLFTKPAGTGSPNSLLFDGLAQCVADGCYAPYNVTATTSGTTTTVSWADVATGSWVYYLASPTDPEPTSATTPTGTVTTNPFNITTAPNTEYVIYVKQNCFGMFFSDWSEGFSFDTYTGYSVSAIVMADTNGDGVCNDLDTIITGIEVLATLNGTAIPSLFTGENASVSFDNLPEGEGTFTLQPIAPEGYETAEAETITLDFTEENMVYVLSFCLEPIPTTGLKDTVLNNVTLYPNPVKNVLTVQTQNVAVENIIVFDVNGRQCLSVGNTNSIDMHALTTGIYFVRVTTANGVEVKKVIKE